jgi:hypothetical protein
MSRKPYSQLLETQVPEKGKEDEKASPSATDLGHGINLSTRAKCHAYSHTHSTRCHNRSR